jgi:3-phosphoshikimate 1-carboxyvinyltransferase
MNVQAVRSPVKGSVDAPSSKSAMQRYIAGSLLANGISHIHSTMLCEDSLAALEIAKALGAEVSVEGKLVIIKGGFNPGKNQIFTGESGLSTRMFSPIVALHDSEITITGKGSVLKRPVGMVERPLSDLGVRIRSNNGFLPMKIKGPMKGGRVKADGSVSSQFITGLLMALPVVNDDSLIMVENLVSKPYIDLTVKILKEFGIEIENKGYVEFLIKGGQQYSPGNFNVEGDWSGAAFLLVMGAIGGEVMVTGLDTRSVQADKAIIDALARAGAVISYSDNLIRVSGGDLHGFEFNLSDCPDLAPPLTILALACKGKSILKGAGRLAAKESDRGEALQETMSLLGAKVKNYGEYIEIEGGTLLNGGSAASHNDHRIAMTLAVAALISKKPVVIGGMECINKSYPGFIDDYVKLGGILRIM